jgi:benzoyl-CoA reductase/2-hydroxyglutaryl-CoA dehydratase subunit BcrC/BadD/HgdB
MKIGFTSTIPVETVFAAGHVPVDLNNLFVLSGKSASQVTHAKMQGFPDTTCAWICGLYTTALESGIDALIGVTGGDCSETLALMEVLACKGMDIIPFSYPHSPDHKELRKNIEKLAVTLGTEMNAVQEWKDSLDEVRATAADADRLLWRENKGTGETARLIQLSCTDFESNPAEFHEKIKKQRDEISAGAVYDDVIRLGVCGVPPIISDFYKMIEQNGCRVVFSEVERQFSLPFAGDIASAYSQYTYPYGMPGRVKDISRAIEERRLDGVIHYVQSFCFRSIEDIVLRNSLSIPVLTLQGDLPSRVSETMGIRIEAFVDMLMRRREKRVSGGSVN